LATLLTAWITATVTRPLRRLTEAVGTVQRDGLTAGLPSTRRWSAHRTASSSIAAGRVWSAGEWFPGDAATLRTQWEALRRLDHFRREGVSNLSHDLRSPLTATTACLETLEARWHADRIGAPIANWSRWPARTL
jgi:signal transduction histidine kinase